MEILKFIDVVVESKFGSLGIVLALFAILTMWFRRTTIQQRREYRIALIECRRDAVQDVGFMTSLMAITREYRMLLVTVIPKLGGDPPKSLAEVDRQFDQLRMKIHDTRTARVNRLNKVLEKLDDADVKEEV